MNQKKPAALFAALFTFIFSLFITTCATVQTTVPDELDIAIRDASDYLNANLPAKSKIVILNIQSDSAALSDYIIDELIANAVNDRNFEVVDRHRLDLIRAEQNFQWSGEVDDTLALEIGKFFEAQTIVSGTVRELGDRYRFTLRALEVQTARVQGQYNRNIAAGKTIVALMRSRGGSANTAYGTPNRGNSTSTTSGSGTVTPIQVTPPAQAQRTGPKIGTYTFSPRLRATNAGVYIDAYIVKIVVQERYMLIYQTNVPSGTRARAAPGYWYLSGEGKITDLDNPTRAWTKIRHVDNPDGPNTGEVLSFDGVTATRFSLECSWYGINIYNEINLANAQFEE